MLLEVDYDADGTLDSITTHTYTYDVDGNLTQSVREVDNPADGTVDFIETTTYSGYVMVCE